MPSPVECGTFCEAHETPGRAVIRRYRFTDCLAVPMTNENHPPTASASHEWQRGPHRVCCCHRGGECTSECCVRLVFERRGRRSWQRIGHENVDSTQHSCSVP